MLTLKRGYSIPLLMSDSSGLLLFRGSSEGQMAQWVALLCLVCSHMRVTTGDVEQVSLRCQTLVEQQTPPDHSPNAGHCSHGFVHAVDYEEGYKEGF